MERVWAICRKANGTYTVCYVKEDRLIDVRSWANIDYVLASAVKGTGVRRIMNSYDVGCEHEKGFFVRAQEFPELISLDLPRDAWVFVVPKFHVSAHKPECQGMFSPNYVPHAARFDGEHVERLWSFLNPSASSLKEMGPGARKETLDDLCAFNNWRKTVKFGENTHTRSSSYC